MPNHVTTIITARPEIIDSIMSKGQVDFNNIIPMPDDSDPMFTEKYVELIPGFGGYGLGGYSPMDWSRGSWGTKWNAYDTERNTSGVVQFDTAWSHPEPVIEALSTKFPEDKIFVKYADEDLGSNLGEYTIQNGIVLEDREFGHYTSDDALDFASQIKYGKSYDEVKAEWDED